MNDATLAAIVLAGERPGGNALARAHGLAAGVLVDVAGVPCLARVIATLRASRRVHGGLLVGPAAPLPQSEPALCELLAPGDFRWMAPQAGPSASALAAVDALDSWPLLLTAGDHALLTPAIVDEFCAAALARPTDLSIALVPYATVKRAFPDSRRTRLAFRDGTWCGANLFLLHRPQARRALAFWAALERDRKRPWRMAARLGPGTLLRYLARRLSLRDALAALSARSGARIDVVPLEHARAAVDVDSLADLELACEVIRHG